MYRVTRRWDVGGGRRKSRRFRGDASGGGGEKKAAAPRAFFHSLAYASRAAFSSASSFSVSARA
jgi:hypothetical protein